jgi:hypothetical protein
MNRSEVLEAAIPQERMVELLKDGFDGSIAMGVCDAMRIVSSLQARDILVDVWDVLSHRTQDSIVDPQFPYANLVARELASMLNFFDDASLFFIAKLIRSNIDSICESHLAFSMACHNVFNSIFQGEQ